LPSIDQIMPWLHRIFEAWKDYREKRAREAEDRARQEADERARQEQAALEEAEHAPPADIGNLNGDKKKENEEAQRQAISTGRSARRTMQPVGRINEAQSAAALRLFFRPCLRPRPAHVMALGPVGVGDAAAQVLPNRAVPTAPSASTNGTFFTGCTMVVLCLNAAGPA
jgi:hypothetical protein